MEEPIDSVQDFFNQMWRFTTDKHNQGVYNTVCLVVLLTLPLLVLLITLVVCCHCCCCRHANGCCCYRRDAMATARSETKKKKNSANTDDLWISVKTGQMTPDRIPLDMV
ncbi:unnamed protein product [Pleuronectes platessa]|uniref:KIAA0040 n=1 Tax=Pleuronectes platessa TaxID=8262 RepID=A0A9N7VCK1_PLEPL|nr:uncharacterized protein KIAA0040 homolog [Pleuronectes platessa]CAB1449886.1 unnamed protein product [Pleuronectes platessa]